MFRFEYINHLYALALIPLLLMLFVLASKRREKALAALGEKQLVSQLMPSFSRYKQLLKFGLLLLALVFLIVAWANPQWGTKREKAKRKSVDIFLALDVSQSMLAQDIAPNRLERAKNFAQKLINELKGDRIGTVIFAGNAYLQMPLTTDYAAAQLFIKSTNTDMVPTQGTAIAEAIDFAERSFEKNDQFNKALIILTDGETHDEGAVERAKKAQKNGIMLYTIGVGTKEGGMIPITENGMMDYKRDENGNPVHTAVNGKMLAELAEAGAGISFNLDAGDAKILESLREHIAKMEKREMEQRLFSEYESYFQYFLFIALCLLIANFFISYQKTGLLSGKDFFD